MFRTWQGQQRQWGGAAEERGRRVQCPIYRHFVYCYFSLGMFVEARRAERHTALMLTGVLFKYVFPCSLSLCHGFVTAGAGFLEKGWCEE